MSYFFDCLWFDLWPLCDLQLPANCPTSSRSTSWKTLTGCLTLRESWRRTMWDSLFNTLHWWSYITCKHQSAVSSHAVCPHPPPDPQPADRTGSDVSGSVSGPRASDVCVEAQHESVRRSSGQDRLPAGHIRQKSIHNQYLPCLVINPCSEWLVCVQTSLSSGRFYSAT